MVLLNAIILISIFTLFKKEASTKRNILIVIIFCIGVLFNALLKTL